MQGGAGGAKYELYEYPGRFMDNSAGEGAMRQRMQAAETDHNQVVGQSRVRTLSPARRWTPYEVPHPERHYPAMVATKVTPPDPLGWLLLDERLGLVREALGKIPPRDAEILLLKYTENWSCRDLANHLGQTEAAVESRLHRARGRLRDELAGSNVIEVRR